MLQQPARDGNVHPVQAAWRPDLAAFNAPGQRLLQTRDLVSAITKAVLYVAEPSPPDYLSCRRNWDLGPYPLLISAL